MPAAIEEEQPSPKSGLSTISQPVVSTVRCTSAGRAAQGQHRLVEAAVPGGRQHGVEEHAPAVGEELLGPAQTPRGPGRQDQPRRPVLCGRAFRE